LFRRLAVFSGGFTLDAAEEVCGLDLDHDVLSGLASLLNKSLLQRDATARGDQRFVMLGTIREYALERLELSAEMPLLRERHGAWALRLAELVGASVNGPRQLASLARCEDDHDNFRAALAWFAEGDGIEVLRLAVALAPFWKLHSHLSEGRQWLDLALAGPSSNLSLRCRALFWNEQLTGDAGDYGRAEDLLKEAMELAIATDDVALRGRIGAELAWMVIMRGDISDGVVRCQEAVELLRMTTDYDGLGGALHTLGHAQGDATGLESARAAWEESLRLFRGTGDGWNQAQLLKDLGLIACRSGDLSAAAEAYEESLVILRETGASAFRRRAGAIRRARR
jgi:non-specific serine/threonine protein kinase